MKERRLFDRTWQLASSDFEDWDRMDLIPIEGTTEGWYCLNEQGAIVHLSKESAVERVAPKLSVALIGRLSCRYPIATAFLPRVEADVCPTCKGIGRVPELPPNLANVVACECGGLGWVWVAGTWGDE